MRAVAEAAGVTPGLVVHHFGTKERLVAQVDELVIQRFSAAMAVDTHATTTPAAAQAIAARLSQTIGADPDLRRYVRRSILDASPAGQAILQRLIDLTVDNLRRHTDPTKLPTGRDLTWLALQIVTINLAGTLLEPLLEPLLGHDPFTPAEVRRRTTANLDLITTALTPYTPDHSDARTDHNPGHDGT